MDPDHDRQARRAWVRRPDVQVEVIIARNDRINKYPIKRRRIAWPRRGRAKPDGITNTGPRCHRCGWAKPVGADRRGRVRHPQERADPTECATAQPSALDPHNRTHPASNKSAQRLQDQYRRLRPAIGISHSGATNGTALTTASARR